MGIDFGNAPPSGQDYRAASPIGNISYGVADRVHGARINTAHSVALRRLYPVDRDISPVPTCYRYDVLLPLGAPDACRDPQALCDHFEAQARADQYDVAVIMTLRFDARASRHEHWELHRAFARDEFVLKRDLPVVAVMHVPQISCRIALPHTHLVILARRLLGPDFGDFPSDLLRDPAAGISACAAAFDTFAATYN